MKSRDLKRDERCLRVSEVLTRTRRKPQAVGQSPRRIRTGDDGAIECSERLSEKSMDGNLSEELILGATVTALRGRVFATTKARRRKAVTVAP